MTERVPVVGRVGIIVDRDELVIGEVFQDVLELSLLDFGRIAFFQEFTDRFDSFDRVDSGTSAPTVSVD